MGYKVLVAEGSPVVLKIIVSGYVDAIVGVACLNVLEKAIDKILLVRHSLHGRAAAVERLSQHERRRRVGQPDDSDAAGATRRTDAQLRALAARGQRHVSRRHVCAACATAAGQSTVGRNADPIHWMDSTRLPRPEALGLDFVSRGGKYSRPFMTLATYDALSGGDATLDSRSQTHRELLRDSVLRAAMSIEMFHKASLVHDDIEDDDGYRYGLPTMHRRYGLPTAINVGDYLIGLGYRMVSRSGGELGSDCTADILDCLAGAHTRLAEGQGAELLWRDAKDKRLSPLDALKVYALKTAPAFEAALFTGARLAGDVKHLTEPIKLFARNIGVAFQILNDLADWEGDQHNKLEAGGDVLGGRPTLLWAGPGESLRRRPEPATESGWR